MIFLYKILTFFLFPVFAVITYLRRFSNKEDKTSNLPADPLYSFEKTWNDGRIAPVKKIHTLWAESINNQTPVIPGLSEGLRSQRVCEAIIQSSESGICIKI